MTPEELAQIASDAAAKKILKEAIDEWLDNKFLMFGKWSFYGFVASVVAACCWLLLISNGWHKP